MIFINDENNFQTYLTIEYTYSEITQSIIINVFKTILPEGENDISLFTNKDKKYRMIITKNDIYDEENNKIIKLAYIINDEVDEIKMDTFDNKPNGYRILEKSTGLVYTLVDGNITLMNILEGQYFKVYETDKIYIIKNNKAINVTPQNAMTIIKKSNESLLDILEQFVMTAIEEIKIKLEI